MVIIVVIYILGSHFCVTEARVFCEDSNASPWTPFGYTCPVLCATVVNAIKRLQIMDYKKTIFQDLSLEPLNDMNEVDYNIERSTQIKKEKLNFDKHKFSNKIIKQKREIYFSNYASELHNLFNKAKYTSPNYENTKPNMNLNDDKIVYNNYKTDEIIKFVNNMASLLKMADGNATAPRTGFNNSTVLRRFNLDHRFVSIMTNILNKYVSSTFKFTQEMTEVILNKLFNSDARTRLYDVGKLLKYLRKAVHVNNNVNNYVITLRPRNCMSIRIPGCFCKQGYVENSGQCVEPAKCLSDESLLVYLNRIVIS